MMLSDWQQFLANFKASDLADKKHSSENPSFLFDLSSLGILAISGQDAEALLQGQLTCNVMTLTNHTLRIAAHCHPQGRVISLFWIYKEHDTFYLMMPRNMILLLMNSLKKYAIFFKVAMHDKSDELSIIGYSSPTTPAFEKITTLTFDASTQRQILIGEINVMKKAWLNLMTQANYLDETEWQALNMQQKIPTIYPETSQKFLPHELNLPLLNAIDFDKGCFTGQEIIARMHYRGKLKTKLMSALLQTDKTFSRGDDIYTFNNHSAKTAGSIVDFCQQNENSYQLLIITETSNSDQTLCLLNDTTNTLTDIH